MPGEGLTPEAAAAAREVLGVGVVADYPSVVTRVAAALLAAEARGREQAQRIVDVELAAQRRTTAANKTGFAKGALAAFENIDAKLRALAPAAPKAPR